MIEHAGKGVAIIAAIGAMLFWGCGNDSVEFKSDKTFSCVMDEPDILGGPGTGNTPPEIDHRPPKLFSPSLADIHTCITTKRPSALAVAGRCRFFAKAIDQAAIREVGKFSQS